MIEIQPGLFDIPEHVTYLNCASQTPLLRQAVTAGKSGIAHMLEHLMFKGTHTIGPGQFSKIIERHGGNDNAFTSHDYTGYYQNIARDRLEMVMEMEADRMVDLVFTEQDFQTERDVVLEERRSRTEERSISSWASMRKGLET